MSDTIYINDWEVEKANEYVDRKGLPITGTELLVMCRKNQMGFSEVVEYVRQKFEREHPVEDTSNGTTRPTEA